MEIFNLPTVAQSLNNTTMIEQRNLDDEIPAEFLLADFLPEGDMDEEARRDGEKTQRGQDKPLKFVLIQRSRGGISEEWAVAEEDAFNDVINDVLAELTNVKSPATKSFAWADSKRGIIALKPESKTRLANPPQSHKNLVCRRW